MAGLSWSEITSWVQSIGATGTLLVFSYLFLSGRITRTADRDYERERGEKLLQYERERSEKALAMVDRLTDQVREAVAAMERHTWGQGGGP